MASPGHRANILSDQPPRLGCAASPAHDATGLEVLYGAQVFFTPAGDPKPALQATEAPELRWPTGRRVCSGADRLTAAGDVQASGRRTFDWSMLAGVTKANDPGITLGGRSEEVEHLPPLPPI